MHWYKAFRADMRGLNGMKYEEGKPVVDPAWNEDPETLEGLSFCDTAISPWDYVPHTCYSFMRQVHPFGPIIHLGGHRYKSEGLVPGRIISYEEMFYHSDEDHGIASGTQFIWGKDTQTIYLFGEAASYLTGEVLCYAQDASTAYASDNVVVYAKDKSRVIARGQSRIYSWEHKGTVALSEDARVSPGTKTKIQIIDGVAEGILNRGQSFLKPASSLNTATPPSIFDDTSVPTLHLWKDA